MQSATTSLTNTLGFFKLVFGAGQSIVGVWAAPAALNTVPRAGERSPLPFGMVFGAAGAAQTAKIDDSRPAQKPCIKNPGESGLTEDNDDLA